MAETLTTSGIPARRRRVAAIDRVRGERVLVIAEGNGSPEIRGAAVYPTDDALAGAVRRARADWVVHAAPASGCVVRSVSMPEGEGDELVAALALMAEAQLPARLEAHRRAAGLAPGERGPAGHAATLVGWAAPDDDRPWTAPIAGVKGQGWACEAVGVAWLAARAGGSVVLSDPERGTLVAARPAGVSTRVLRTTREAPGAEWQRRASDWAREALGGEGVDAALFGAESAALVPGSPESAGRAFGGSEEITAAWLGRFGVAASLACACVGSEASSSGLFTMAPMPIEPRISAADRAVRWIATPWAARAVAGAAALALVAGPLVLAEARALVLEEKERAYVRPERAGVDPEAGADEGSRASTDLLRREAAFYEELARQRWPMTKLLSDLSGAMPVGVEARSVRLTAGDGFVVRGVAGSLSDVNTFSERLQASGVFQNVQRGRTERMRGEGESGVEFDLSGSVGRPLAEVRDAEDFRERTLAVRLYGRDVAAQIEAERAEETGGSGGASAGSGRRSGSTGGSGRAAIFDGRDGDRAAEPEPIPEPLTDDQIGAMERQEAMREWVDRRKSATRGDLEESDRVRLEDEVQRLRNRLEELRGSGS